MPKPPGSSQAASRPGALDLRGKILRMLLRYMLALGIAFGLAGAALLPENRMRGLIILLAMTLPCLSAYLVLRRGHVTAAAVVFLAVLGASTTAITATAGGAGAVSFTTYLCIVLMAGLLFGRRGGLRCAAICLLSAGAVVAAGGAGWLPPSQVNHNPLSFYVTHALFILWTALIVIEYTRIIESAKLGLAERVKELTALHEATQLLHGEGREGPEMLGRLARLIPPAYRFPEHASARVRLGKWEAVSPGYAPSRFMQKAMFTASDGSGGSVEVAYGAGVPRKRDLSPFLPEEQALIDTIADLLRSTHERRAADAALQASESRLRELFDTARDTLYQLAPDGSIVSLNPAFEAVTGWKRDAWIGKPFATLLHPSDVSQVSRHFRSAMKGQESPLYEARVRTASGGYVNAEFLGVPRRHDGRVVGVLGIARDLTERRRLEEQVHRTQRLESLGTIAGGIAHDLNNVLTPILLASEMLQKRVEDEKGRRLTAAIAAAAKRGSGIVKQILTFARGGGGETRPLQLRGLIAEMETFVRETFPRHLEIRFEAPEGLPQVLGDPTQIHQVLLNLCVNARDSMPEGGRLTVSAGVERFAQPPEKDVPPGEYGVLSVADTGGGIDPEIMARIFEPFFTTKEKGEGTGLGLSTTFSIVRAHRGFIRVSSEPGRTEFQAFFPTAHGGARPEEASEVRAPMGRGQTILVVDDEQVSLSFIREILEANGYAVLTALDGIEGLSAFGAAPRGTVRLVISDIDMPRMGGVEFSRRLRELDPGARILLASGGLAALEAPEEIRGGELLSKPYTANELLSRVGRMLEDGASPA